MQILIDNGADIDAVNDDGKTAALQASKKGHLDALNLLIAAGADLNIIAGDGEGALNVAKTDAIRDVLIAAGATMDGT